MFLLQFLIRKPRFALQDPKGKGTDVPVFKGLLVGGGDVCHVMLLSPAFSGL